MKKSTKIILSMISVIIISIIIYVGLTIKINKEKLVSLSFEQGFGDISRSNNYTITLWENGKVKVTTGGKKTKSTVFYVDKNIIDELKDIINENEDKVKFEELDYGRLDYGTITITLYKDGKQKNIFSDSFNKAGNENFDNICQKIIEIQNYK